MTLYSDLGELADFAVDDDLQSITGVWLRGFTTDFSQVLNKIRGFATTGGAVTQAPWAQILRALDWAYNDTPFVNAPGNSLRNTPAPGVGLNKPLDDIQTTQLAKRLSIDPRDYNYFNKLLGFGAKDERLSSILKGAGDQFGLDPAIVQDPDFIHRYCELINLARGRSVATPINGDGNHVPLGGGTAGTEDALVSELDSRLYLKLDLSEWLFLNDPDILYVVVEPAHTLNGYYPLGRTTIWLSADAQVQHVRSKTSKTFLRGQIAQRLRIEDIESNIAGFVNTIFDTDSEQAYSTSSGPC